MFKNILIADDEASIRHVLTLALTEKGYAVRAVTNGEEALRELSTHPYQVLVSDVRMPKVGGLSLLGQALILYPDLTVIIMSAYGSPETALQAVASGAYDYLSKPFKPEEMILILQKAEERRRLVKENKWLKEAIGASAPLQKIKGQGTAMVKVRQQIAKLAPVNTTVLITGESGTGKELVAQALHQLSPRSGMAFVALNCGAFPSGLIESELFGHAKGAFTDAHHAKRGLLTEADGGTLFLDEVGELPLSAQVKLLRFIQEGEVRPVGENQAEKVDVRIVAATLRDLSKLVQRGEFREDLFYRLNVVNLHVPPLRERGTDIIELTLAFIHRFNRELNRETRVTSLAPDAEAACRSYLWPGNVRELENAIERAVLLAETEQITLEDLPEKILGLQKSSLQGEGIDNLSLKLATRSLEVSFIAEALRRTKGNRTRAAELLEVSHRTLLYKIKEYGIIPDIEK